MTYPLDNRVFVVFLLSGVLRGIFCVIFRFFD